MPGRAMLMCWTVLIALASVVGCQSPAPAPSTASTRATATSTTLPSPSVPPVGAGRVETLNAADAAFEKGDLGTASGLYERVINTPPTGEPAATATVITEFAYFRDMVTLLADGREDDAHAQLDALQQADANGPLTRLATQLWDQYGMIGQLRGACAQLQPQVASQAGATLGTLQALGVTVDTQTLCSVPTKG